MQCLTTQTTTHEVQERGNVTNKEDFEVGQTVKVVGENHPLRSFNVVIDEVLDDGLRVHRDLTNGNKEEGIVTFEEVSKNTEEVEEGKPPEEVEETTEAPVEVPKETPPADGEEEEEEE